MFTDRVHLRKKKKKWVGGAQKKPNISAGLTVIYRRERRGDVQNMNR